MAIRTYYEILGVPHDADEGEIRRGFRRAIREVHPDQNPDDRRSARRSRELNEARTTLLDAEKRRRYDEKLRRKGMFPDAPAEVEERAAEEASPAGEEFSFAPEWMPPDPQPSRSAGTEAPGRDPWTNSRAPHFGGPPNKPKRARKAASGARRVPWEFLVLIMLLMVSIGMFLYFFSPKPGWMDRIAKRFQQSWNAQSAGAEPDPGGPANGPLQPQVPKVGKAFADTVPADAGNVNEPPGNAPKSATNQRPPNTTPPRSTQPANSATPKFSNPNRGTTNARPQPRTGPGRPSINVRPARPSGGNPAPQNPVAPARPDAGPRIVEAKRGVPVNVSGIEKVVIVRGECDDLMIGGTGKRVLVENMVGGELGISGVEHQVYVRGTVASIVGSGVRHEMTVEELGKISLSGIGHRLRYVRGRGGKPVQGLQRPNSTTPSPSYAGIERLSEFPALPEVEQ